MEYRKRRRGDHRRGYVKTEGRRARSKRRPGKGLLFLRAMMALCAIAAMTFAGLLLVNGAEYARGDAAYEQMRAMLRGGHGGDAASIRTPAAVATAENPGITGLPERSASTDFAPLRAINKDVVGWLHADGTVIDYPVVQTQDNEYYLTHLFNRQRNKLGSLFMDYRNRSDFSGKNTVIYGHNMKDGSMFASLVEYRGQRYYDRFPTMELYTPDGDLQIELFAGIVADGDAPFLRFDFQDDEDFLGYIRTIKGKSTFHSNTAVGAEDRIITLCTCSYAFHNARYALFGKMATQR